MNKPTIQEEATIPLDRVAKFIRQLTHDVRNGLSAADLEAAFVEEISADAEVLAEIRKLREMIADTAKMLRGVSLYFQPASVHPIPWEARLLLEELRKRVEIDLPEQAGAIQIVNQFGGLSVEIDMEQTIAILMAVLNNAVHWMKEGDFILVTGASRGDGAVVEICEPKPDFVSQVPPEQWGTLPLYSTRPGGYGLGLFHARKIAAAQGSRLEIGLSGGELRTVITLPSTAKAPS